MERGRKPGPRPRALRRGEHGTHPVLIAIAAILVLVIVVVIFLLLQKPKQVTPIAVVGTSPSASAASTPTAIPVTVPPTQAPTQTPTELSTNPGFAGLEAPSTVSCKNAGISNEVYPPITWSVVNATGVTVAIDSPGQKWADYGPSGRTDQQSEALPFRCDAQPLQHTYYFTTTGGSGPEVTRTVTIKGTN